MEGPVSGRPREDHPCSTRPRPTGRGGKGNGRPQRQAVPSYSGARQGADDSEVAVDPGVLQSPGPDLDVPRTGESTNAPRLAAPGSLAPRLLSGQGPLGGVPDLDSRTPLYR